MREVADLDSGERSVGSRGNGSSGGLFGVEDLVGEHAPRALRVGYVPWPAASGILVGNLRVGGVGSSNMTICFLIGFGIESGFVCASAWRSSRISALGP